MFAPGEESRRTLLVRDTDDPIRWCLCIVDSIMPHQGSTGGQDDSALFFRSLANHAPPASKTAPDPTPVRYGLRGAVVSRVAQVSTWSRATVER